MTRRSPRTCTVEGLRDGASARSERRDFARDRVARAVGRDRDVARALDISVEADTRDSAPVMIHESLRPARDRGRASAPILLDRKRPSDPPITKPADAAPEPSRRRRGRRAAAQADQVDAVVAQARRAPDPGRHRRRRHAAREARHREAMPAAGRRRHHRRAREGRRGDRSRDRCDPTRVDTFAAPHGDEISSDEIAAPPAPVATTTPARSRCRRARRRRRCPAERPGRLERQARAVVARRGRRRDSRRSHGKPTMVMPAVALDATTTTMPSGARPARRSRRRCSARSRASTDARSGIIPLPDIDSPPLMVAPPSPPEHTRAHSTTEARRRARARGRDGARARADPPSRARAEPRRGRRGDDRAPRARPTGAPASSRSRSGELSLFAITPRPRSMPYATLRLDRPSTLQDVVGTRLPYRGPMHDDASRDVPRRPIARRVPARDPARADHGARARRRRAVRRAPHAPHVRRSARARGARRRHGARAHPQARSAASSFSYARARRSATSLSASPQRRDMRRRARTTRAAAAQQQTRWRRARDHVRDRRRPREQRALADVLARIDLVDLRERSVRALDPQLELPADDQDTADARSRPGGSPSGPRARRA